MKEGEKGGERRSKYRRNDAENKDDRKNEKGIILKKQEGVQSGKEKEDRRRENEKGLTKEIRNEKGTRSKW